MTASKGRTVSARREKIWAGSVHQLDVAALDGRSATVRRFTGKSFEMSNTQNHRRGIASFGAAFAALALTTVMATSAIAEPIDVGNTESYPQNDGSIIIVTNNDGGSGRTTIVTKGPDGKETGRETRKDPVRAPKNGVHGEGCPELAIC